MPRLQLDTRRDKWQHSQRFAHEATGHNMCTDNWAQHVYRQLGTRRRVRSRIDMCVDVRVDMCVDMRVNMRVDMCVDMCIGLYV